MSVVEIPVIDASVLMTKTNEIAEACRGQGFFYITGHGIDERLQQRLEEQSRIFFALPLEEKLKIRMELGGRAWRGYFPPGGELTSGVPDSKEGIYFGEELSSEDPRVEARTQLHGSNLFPVHPAELRETVLEYMSAMINLSHRLIAAISLSLGLNEDYLHEHYTRTPLTLFRIFNYPVSKDNAWGVGEHTDYGLLTILKQDNTGGLEIKTKSGWIEAAPLAGSFVCNVGDMLERLTRGVYRSTAHRVRASRDHDRLSFPFFFDPDFNAVVRPIAQLRDHDNDRYERWDGENVYDFEGTYGDYIVRKVTRVFPHLLKD